MTSRSILPHRHLVARVALVLFTALALAAPAGAGRTIRPGKLSLAEAQAKKAMAPASSGLFVADGVQLPYLREGEGDVVVILPDSTESLEAWRPQVAALGDRFLAVAYLRRSEESAAAGAATPGHDPTDAVMAPIAAADRRNLGSPSTVDARHLRDLVLLVASLSSGPVHLVGEGDGARLALRLALEHPERVRSLVLSSPDPHWFARDAEIESARRGGGVRASADTMLACRRMWKIRVPVLVLSGEHDWRTFGDTPPLRCVRTVKEQTLRGATMRPHAQGSQEFNRVVSRFLDRQRMTASDQ